MNIEEDNSEVCFTVKIPNFSSYKDFTDSFTTEFPIKVNNFSSLWSLKLSPFVEENGFDGTDPINRDIGIVLKCLRCNVNFPEIEIYSKVQGRDQHEKQLPQRCSKELTWQGILMSRLGLKVFRLLSDNQLTWNLKFVVKGCDMARTVDGVEGLAKDMKVLFERGTYSDVDILTSDGIKIPAHMAVLQYRSNLLERISATKKRHLPGMTTPEPLPKSLKTEMSSSKAGGIRDIRSSDADSEISREEAFPLKAETPINSTFGSISSGYQSCRSRSSSPEHQQGVGRVSLASISSDSKPPRALTPSKQNSNMVSNARYSCSPNKVLFRPRRTTPRRLSQMYKVHSEASPASAGLLSCKKTPNKFAGTPCGTPPPKISVTPTRTPVLGLPPTPKRSTPGKYSLSATKASPSKPTRTPLVLSPSKRSRATMRLSITKRSSPSRRSSIGKPAPKTPSPTKRLHTPMRLSSQKVQLLRRTPIIGEPSPRRRLYQGGEEIFKETCSSRKPFEASQGTNASGLTSITAKGGRPLKEFPRDFFTDSPAKGKLSLSFGEADGRRPEIKVNMSASVTRPLLEWLYTGMCSDMNKLARALLVGGIRHGMGGLARACEYHLTAALTPVNAPETIFLAQKYSAHLLQEAALNYAVTEASAVTSQPVWGILADRAPAMVAEFSRRLAGALPPHVSRKIPLY